MPITQVEAIMLAEKELCKNRPKAPKVIVSLELAACILKGAKLLRANDWHCILCMLCFGLKSFVICFPKKVARLRDRDN